MDASAEPAAARAYRALERMIVTLELPPASITTEGALLEKLALGRTPVREAIQRLSWEGLLKIKPRSGLAIAPLHAADWALVIDARKGVEEVLARSAARNISATTQLYLRDAVSAMRAAVSTADALAFLKADKLLDEIMAEASGNVFATRVATPLQIHSRRFWYCYRNDTALEQSAEHHIALTDAILERDEEHASHAAERLMSMLLNQARQAVYR